MQTNCRVFCKLAQAQGVRKGNRTVQYWLKKRKLNLHRFQNYQMQIEIILTCPTDINVLYWDINVKIKVNVNWKAQLNEFNKLVIMILTGDSFLHNVVHFAAWWDDPRAELIHHKNLYERTNRSLFAVFTLTSTRNKVKCKHDIHKWKCTTTCLPFSWFLDSPNHVLHDT